MKAIVILIVVIVGICAPDGVGQTNALWFKTVVPSTNALPLRKICEMVETESAKLATNGCGLKVLYSAEIERMFKGGEVSFTAEPCPLCAMLENAARCCELSVKFFDTVAVLVWPEHRYVCTAVEGTCVDAETGAPVMNFRIKAAGLDTMLAVQTNGFFVCGIPQNFDYSWSPNAIFSDSDISGIQQVVTITAPGYVTLVITNALYGDKTGSRCLDIKLKRFNKDEQKANPTSERAR